jgi:hypothetical protein
MIAVDTNILVRYLTNDDPPQVRPCRVRDIFSSRTRGLWYANYIRVRAAKKCGANPTTTLHSHAEYRKGTCLQNEEKYRCNSVSMKVC